MERRKFLIAGAGVFLSVAFLGRITLRDDKINESSGFNSNKSIKDQIVNTIYPESGEALYHLKLAVKENKVFL